MNLPFESTPESITQLSSAPPRFRRAVPWLRIGRNGKVPVLYCKILLIVLTAVPLLQEQGTQDVGQQKAMIENTYRSNMYILKEYIAENTNLKLTIKDSREINLK